MTTEAVQPHNQKAAATWSSGGASYEGISRMISDSIEHCIFRVGPKEGERVLDLACGTGWVSRSVARQYSGVKLFGIDIGPELIEAAKAKADAARATVDYRVADAEKLPFEDGYFDAVISTCGIMFAGRPEAAAAELIRVTKPGGPNSSGGALRPCRVRPGDALAATCGEALQEMLREQENVVPACAQRGLSLGAPPGAHVSVVVGDEDVARRGTADDTTPDSYEFARPLSQPWATRARAARISSSSSAARMLAARPGRLSLPPRTEPRST